MDYHSKISTSHVFRSQYPQFVELASTSIRQFQFVHASFFQLDPTVVDDVEQADEFQDDWSTFDPETIEQVGTLSHEQLPVHHDRSIREYGRGSLENPNPSR